MYIREIYIKLNTIETKHIITELYNTYINMHPRQDFFLTAVIQNEHNENAHYLDIFHNTHFPTIYSNNDTHIIKLFNADITECSEDIDNFEEFYQLFLESFTVRNYINKKIYLEIDTNIIDVSINTSIDLTIQLNCDDKI